MGMIIAVDFDGVIHDHKKPVNKMGPPISGAESSLMDLYDAGHTLIIHTVKASTPSGRKAVEDWLEHFDIKYHRIEAKPEADLYIDDRALKFTDWGRIDGLFESDE